MKETPRGIRNNNPLNIRYVKCNNWVGRVAKKKDKDFEEFVEMAFGLRAAFVLINNYIKSGCNTIGKIIARWAPMNENNTAAYIDFVLKRTGYIENTIIQEYDAHTLMHLVEAMAFMECGQHISWTIIATGYLWSWPPQHQADLVEEYEKYEIDYMKQQARLAKAK